MTTPVIRTKKLILRPLSILDAEKVFAGWSGDAEANRFLEWERHKNVMTTIQWLSAQENAQGSERNYTWGIEQVETRELVGSCGIVYQPEAGLFEFGCVIAKKHWRRGIASEAAQEIKRFAKEKLNLTTLYAKCAKENPASRRVLEKTGFLHKKDGEYVKAGTGRMFECGEYVLDLSDIKG